MVAFVIRFLHWVYYTMALIKNRSLYNLWFKHAPNLNHHFFWPLRFALADNVYRTMISETNNHFILISGESGAGKTEASKKVLQFYAGSCPSTRLLEGVRDRLLLSNPVLEVSWIQWKILNVSLYKVKKEVIYLYRHSEIPKLWKMTTQVVLENIWTYSLIIRWRNYKYI